MEPAQHALRQHDRSGAVIKELSDVAGLYARVMSSAGLAPIPFPRSTRENLGIPERPDALDFDLTPGEGHDARRSSAAFGGRL
jgi:hypothetical protein